MTDDNKQGSQAKIELEAKIKESAKSGNATKKQAAQSTESLKSVISSKNPRGILSGFAIFLSVLVIVAVALLGYFFYQQLVQQSERLISLEQQEQNTQSTSENIAAVLQQQMTDLQISLQQNFKKQKIQADQQIKQLSEQLLTTQRNIQSVSGRQQTDWFLAEADYLVRIASSRLLLEGDHITALALLLSADQRILLIDDPAMQSARAALSKDMAALRAVQRVDIAGIAIRLSTLTPQLKTLPMLSFQLPEEVSDGTAVQNDAQAEQQPTKVDDGWLTSLKNTINQLSIKWFEVRDHGQKVAPLMTMEDEMLTRLNMGLLLQNAQYAILHQQSELYAQSLQQLQKGIIDYFDSLDPKVAAFIDEVTSLSSQAITKDLPPTLESRTVISRLLDQRLLGVALSNGVNVTTEEDKTDTGGQL